ncbi:MAG: aminotransferase class III-fold pyridoxal phosphate-dependent enzyme [Rhizonema sp. PD37]|nr:aminotransferase class III-fold pyridoxal phosphate-dependent enzyme [Rhizonema sp. PD37]
MNSSSRNSQVNKILSDLKEILGKGFGIRLAETDVHTNFLELGIESLSLIQISRMIQKEFGVQVPFRLLLEEFSTLDELAIHIAQQSLPEPMVDLSSHKESISVLPLPEETFEQISFKTSDKRFSNGSADVSPNQEEEKLILSNLSSTELGNNETLQLNPGSTSSQHRVLLPKNISEGLTANTAIERLVTQQLQIMSKQLDLVYKNSSSKTKMLASSETVQSLPLPESKQQVETSSNVSLSEFSQAESNQQPINQTIETKAADACQQTEKAESGGLNSHQQKCLDALIARVVKRTQESKRLTQAARPFLANPRSITGFRLSIKEMLYPIHIQRGSGARIWDVDDNEYIDLSMGFGPLLFGHSPSFVIEAIQEHIQRGMQNGPQSHLTHKVAELFCEITGQERVTFCNDGTEAVMGAIRIARAITGRSKIAIFAGSYHGNLDEVLVAGVPIGDAKDSTLRSIPSAPGIPQHMSEKVMVLNYGSPESLEILKANAHKLAAVLVEPVQSRQPDFQPKEFLYELRKLTQQTGIILIFDEVITGFRMHAAGIQGLWNIQADITTYGKAVGSGLPIGVIAGKATLMDAFDGGFWSYGDASYPQAETTRFAGTFFKNPLVMAVVWVVLKHIKSSGPQLQERIAQKTAKLVDTLNTYFIQKKLPIRVVHFGSLFRFAYPPNFSWMNLFFYYLLEKGIYVWEGRLCFLSTAHTDEDIDLVIQAVKKSVVEMQEGGFLPPDSISTKDKGFITDQNGGSSNNQTGPFSSLNLESSLTTSSTCGDGDTKTILRCKPSIERVSRDIKLPLSFAQQRMWFLNQIDPDSSAYNEPVALRLRGSLNITALEQSFNEIIRRHEVLRTSYATVDRQPVQIIAPILTLTIPVVDLQELPYAEREPIALRLIDKLVYWQFDLAQGLVLRCTLLRLDETEHIVIFNIHHIVSDTWSMGIFVRELTVLYEAFTAGKASPLPELPIQYADFAVWQRQWFQEEVLETQLTYWKQQLTGNLPVLEIPTDRPRLAVQTFHGSNQSFHLSNELRQALRVLSRQEKCTLFMTLLATFKTLLHCYTQQDDIIVGTDIANRNPAETEGLIGMFLNLLVLRTDLSGNPTFKELLRRVREVTLGAYAHQDLAFDKLVQVLQPERKQSHTPLCQVLLVLDNVPIMPTTLELPSLTVSSIEVYNGTSKFDLVLFMVETEEGIVGRWQYNTDLFNSTTITRMSGNFQTLLSNIVVQPDARINNLEMLTEAEKKEQIEVEAKQEENKFQKFKNFKPKAIKLPQGQLIDIDNLDSGETLPLVLKPKLIDFDLVDWTKRNQEFIETKLQHHGAILFRGFNLNSVLAFENLALAICPELFGEYGDLPRVGISKKVYSSTPYPQDKAILFHNESSHLHRWPLKIWFFCVQAAQQGGETPIVDCRKVYQLLDPKLREKFEQKQLMYVRNYTEGLDVSWQDFFRTTDKTVVENYCLQATLDFEWLSDNSLVTRKVRPAISRHPKTRELVFFNQVQLHHISCLEPAVCESLLSTFSEERLPRNVYYGDGSPIEDSVMEEIEAVYQQAKISFPWQEGDVLMLDNMIVAHGRSPYKGSRKIVVAMGEMICSQNI